MFKLSSLSIRSHMLMIVALMSTVTFGMILYTWIDQRNDNIMEAKGRAAGLVYHISTEQNTIIASSEQLLSTLSHLQIVQQRNTAAVSTLLGNIRKIHPQYANLLMIDEAGLSWASSIPTNIRISYADRRYFKKAITSGRFSSGEYVIGKMLQKPTIGFGAPVRDSSGKITGVATIVFTRDNYLHLMEGTKLPDGSSILFLDHKGTILYSANDPQSTGKRDQTRIFRRISEGPDVETFEAIRADGAPQIISYQKLRLPGEQAPYMYILTSVPFDAAFLATKHDLMHNLCILFALMLLSLVFAIYISKQYVVDKIMTLQNASQQIAQGNLDIRVFEQVSGGELGELGRAFDNMAGSLARDITERRRAEDTLAREQQFTSTLLDNLADGVVACDAEGNLNLFNKTARDWHGLDPLSVPQEQWTEQYSLFEPDGQTLLKTGSIPLVRAFHGEQVRNIAMKIAPKGLPIRDVLASGDPLIDAHGHKLGAVVVMHDITEQRQTLKALIATETKYRNLLESVQMVAVMLDCNGIITFCNDYFLGLTGWRRDEVAGGNFFDMFIPGNLRDSFKATFGSYVSNKILQNYEGVIMTRGGVKRLIVWNKSYLSDAEGTSIGVAFIGKDVTEERHLEEQLRQSQKMEAIGTLAGGVAHDFNNVLTVISGYTYLIRGALDNQSKYMAEEIISSVNRAEEMTKRLLSFSRKQKLQLFPEEINGIIVGLAKSLARLISEDITIRTELSAGPLKTMADKWQIEEVIINLAINARDAMPDGGVLTIKTGEIEILDEEVGLRTIINPGRYVLITVADSGIGMDRQTQERIFEPFFTTKEVGKGTGLGLSMVYGAIRKHKGYVNVYSEPGQGTTINVYLPLLDVQPQYKLEVEDDIITTGDETILIAEDDATIRHMTKTLLQNSGYRVLVAVDGEEAVTVFRDNWDKVQLILMDVIMPRKNGREAMEGIRKIMPDIPTIFLSGYSADVMTRKGILEDGMTYLSKPLKPSVLLKTIRDILDRVA